MNKFRENFKNIDFGANTISLQIGSTIFVFIEAYMLKARKKQWADSEKKYYRRTDG